MKRIISTPNAPKAIGPYSQAIEVSSTLYVSGQLGLDPSTGQMVPGGVREQTEQALKNIGAILNAAGYEFKDVVKSTCLLANMDDFKSMNEVYAGYYPVDPPARAAYAVQKLPLGALVEIESIAVKG
jgi:2-iminobutanoate/2-iminopropanoate deaminase